MKRNPTTFCVINRSLSRGERTFFIREADAIAHATNMIDTPTKWGVSPSELLVVKLIKVVKIKAQVETPRQADFFHPTPGASK